MHISALKQSKFMTRADVGKGILLTIRKIFQDNVAMEDDPEELKWCLSFDEHEKPMVLNTTNIQLVSAATNCDDTDGWPGCKIVLFDDPSIMYKGKMVGGIRIRAPRNQPQPAARPAPVLSVPPSTPPETAHIPPQNPVGSALSDDDIPF